MFAKTNHNHCRLVKRSFFWKTDKKTQALVDLESPLEHALNKMKLSEELDNGKWWWFFRLTGNKRSLAASVIYERIAAQGDRPEFKGSRLPQTFPTWVRLAFLHLWMVDVRFRYIDSWRERNKMTQPLHDSLWQDIEVGIAEILNTSNSILITKHSKRYVTEWFGTALSYDYGMITSDCALAEALWRNLYEGNPDVTLKELSLMVRYVREQQHLLSKISDEDLLNAEFEFIAPPFEIPEKEKKKIEELELLKKESLQKLQQAE